MNAQQSGGILMTMALFFGLLSIEATCAATEPDCSGPRLVSANVLDSGTTNTIEVTFDERLLASSATRRENYSVTLLGTSNQVPIGSIWHMPPGSAQVQLRVATNYWYVGLSNYCLNVNGIQDRSSNTIAPNSRIGIAWPKHSLLLPLYSIWHYQVVSFSDDLLAQRWPFPDFEENPPWPQGAGAFAHRPFQPNCLGSVGTWFYPTGDVALFRIPFVFSPESNAVHTLRFDHLVSGGAIFYLNGDEIFRVNLCPAPKPIEDPCHIIYFAARPLCETTILTTTNLLPGTNWLAVAHRFLYASSPDLAFGLQLQEIEWITGPVPDEDPAKLHIGCLANQAVRLWWSGSGYALESSTNLAPNTSQISPHGWMQVPNMTNPYTNHAPAQSYRFFRLHK